MRVVERPWRQITLAETYRIDRTMAARWQDIELWAAMCSDAGTTEELNAGIVVEVGCGDGRIPAAMLSRGQPPWAAWIGLDADHEMIKAFRRRFVGYDGSEAPVLRCVHGSAGARSTWDQFQPFAGLVDLVIVPYSTLYLIPHRWQASVLRYAGGICRVGGLVAVEAFVPRDDLARTGTRSSQIDLPGGWTRTTEYRVDGARRRTVATRRYEHPTEGRRYVVERIHWRRPNEMPQIAADAGLVGAEVTLGPRGLVPDGSIVLTARAGR